jgi:predicted DNA-binding transcriptional regulator AlpA
VERLLLTAEETAEMLGIGRTKVYELMRLGANRVGQDSRLSTHPH